MTARAGCADLILELRGMTSAGTADYTVNGVSYWTDAHLQDSLDRNRTDLYRDPLMPIQEYDGSGTVIYKKYQSQYRKLEKGDNLDLQDAAGSAVGTALYSVDANTGLFTFASDTGGSSYYLTGYSFDLNGAASEVWRSKAAHYAVAVDFKTDNHSVSRSKIIDNCMQMSSYYKSQSGGGFRSVTMWRSDTDA